ncbi:MAG: hypothetical protein HY319_16515 [Armatimonadetes bacterium]|nr:hypothetical protein [Armatimonadota bacterium]
MKIHSTTRTLIIACTLLVTIILAACSGGGGGSGPDGVPNAGPGAGGQAFTGSLSLRIDVSDVSPRGYDLLHLINTEVLAQYYSPNIDHVVISVIDKMTRRDVHEKTTVFRDPNVDVQVVTIQGVVPGSWAINVVVYDDQGNPVNGFDEDGNPVPSIEKDVIVQAGLVSQVDFNIDGGPGPGPGPGPNGASALFRAVNRHDRQSDPAVALRSNRILVSGVTHLAGFGTYVEGQLFNANGSTVTSAVGPFLMSADLGMSTAAQPAVAMQQDQMDFAGVWFVSSLQGNAFLPTGAPQLGGTFDNPIDVVVDGSFGRTPALDHAEDTLDNDVFLAYERSPSQEVRTVKYTTLFNEDDSVTDPFVSGAPPRPDVGVDGAGTQVITVYVSNSQPTFALRNANDLGVLLDSGQVNAGAPSAGNSAFDIATDMFDDGRSVVVYAVQNPVPQILGRIHDGDSAFGSEFTIASGALPNQQPDVVVDNSNNTFIVTWTNLVDANTSKIMVQRFNPNGSAHATTPQPFLVSQGSPFGRNISPAVAANDQGAFVVGFQAGIGILIGESQVLARFFPSTFGQ